MRQIMWVCMGIGCVFMTGSILLADYLGGRMLWGREIALAMCVTGMLFFVLSTGFLGSADVRRPTQEEQDYED